MKTLPDFWFEPRPWIDGHWHPGVETVTVRNPATAEKIAEVSRADGATVTLAIDGAVKAQRDWREVSAVEPGMVLKRTAALLLTRKDESARLLCAEQGKSHAQAAGEVEYAASFFQWFGEEARRVNQMNVGWTLTANEYQTKLGDGLPPDWPENLPGYAVPSGSLLMPVDIAEAAPYWVSSASRPITGTVFDAEQYPMIDRIPNQENPTP